MALRRSWRPTLAIPAGRRLSASGLADWWKVLEPLWPVGLALVCLLIGHVVLKSPWVDLQGKDYDWGQYVVVGVVYPALLFGVPLIWGWRGWSTAPAPIVKRVLAVACLIMFVVLVVASIHKYTAGHLFWAILALAQAQTILMTRLWGRDEVDPKRTTVLLIVSFTAWTAAASLYLIVFIQPPTFVAGFLVAFVLVCAATSSTVDRRSRSRFRVRTPANIAGLIVIALMSLRTDHLFEVLGFRGALHHWGAWVGTADLVREGGWLLWDVPSMYGFLSILVLAEFPTTTPWQAMYLLNALAFLIVSGGLFLLLRSIRYGAINWCFSLAVAVCVPMFSPNFIQDNPVSSAFIFPNFGPYRYIWVFALVTILVWEFTTDERTRRQKSLLIIGNVAWLIGVLWSPESAFFCSGAWLPAFVLIVLRMTSTDRHRWRSAAAWLALPAVLFAAAVGFIVAFYSIRLDHVPDWRGFTDFVQELGVNVLTVVSDPLGPGLGILFGFCLLAIGAVYGGTRNGLPARSFALWIGLLGATWATSSYGYQRGLAYLHPLNYTALLVMFVLVLRRPRLQYWDAIVRMGMVPLIVIVLVSPFAAVVNNPWALRDVTSSLVSTAGDDFKVEPLMPDADLTLQALMVVSGVKADDPIVYFGDILGNPLLPWTVDGERVIANPHWLPMHPAVPLRYIPPGRGEVYTTRYIERTKLSGWMIQRKTGESATTDFNDYVSGRETWLFELLHDTHIPTRVYENADWQLTWWEYVGDQPDIVRPIEAFGSLGPLAPDIAVDGKPLAGTFHPRVWAQFGLGWGLYDPAIGARQLYTGAILWVYSPDARSATMTLVTTSGAQQSEQISLASGWNQVTISHETAMLDQIEIDTR